MSHVSNRRDKRNSYSPTQGRTTKKVRPINKPKTTEAQKNYDKNC